METIIIILVAVVVLVATAEAVVINATDQWAVVYKAINLTTDSVIVV